MRLVSAFCAVLAALAAGSGAAAARSLDDTEGPAEAPPADFAGNQYVDSEGCVFMRAEQGGRVTWVARVTAARELVCGHTPTFPELAATAPAAAAEAPGPEPAPEGDLYIQVAVFQRAPNAERTVADLKALGIPALTEPGRLRRKAMVFVVAGPFPDAGALAEALDTIRASGFPDAYPK